MAKDKAFYDKQNVLETYLAHRKRPDNPNDALERPIFLQLAGDLQNLDILDLGCGDGLFGKEALAQGAASYTGIEISEDMIQIAQKILTGTPAKLKHKSIEDWRADEQVDLLSSRLSLNYISDIKQVFQEAYKALRPKGRFIISVEHPVISSNYRNLDKGQKTSWLVDDYFDVGAKVHIWLGQEITKYHHTLEDWLGFFEDAGFQIERIRESRPQKENFHSTDEFKRRMRIPLFLFIAARKPK